MPIRVGLVGLNHGSRIHIPAFKHDHRFELVAVCARTPGVAATVAAEHDIPYAYTDVRQLLTSELDLVSIATPPGTHAGVAAAAMALGKHTIVEIPFVSNYTDARVLRDVMWERKRLGVVAQTLHYVPPLRYVSDLLAQKVLGKPFLMRFDFFSSYLALGEGQKWIWEPALGGGVLGSFASHAFGLAQRWLGPVKEVDGVLATFGRAGVGATTRPVADDSGAVVAHFESGALAVLNFCAVSARPRAQIELHGSEATLIVEGFGESISVIKMDDLEPSPLFPPAAYLEATRGESGFLGAFTSMLEDVVNVLQAGKVSPNLPTFMDGLETMRLIEAARRAAREKRRVALTEIP